MKILNILGVLLIVSSCGSGSNRNQVIAETKDLVDTFNLEDKSKVFEKFKVVKIEEEPTKEKEKKVTNTVVKKVKKKKIKITKKIKKKSKLIYPSDYPAAFKKYDKTSKKVWEAFRPIYNPWEKYVFRVSYLGINAGQIVLQTRPVVSVGGVSAYHLQARMTSASFYEYIYKLDDTIESFVEENSFLPVKYSLIQRESGQSVDDLQLFDKDELKTYFWYKRLKQGKEKKRESKTYIPRYFQDSFSPLFFVRGLPLKIGDVYEFPIVTRGKIWMIKLNVKKIEEVKAMGKWYNAIKIDAQTRFPGVLKKKGDITFWYTNDAEKRLLKFEGKIKIGAVEGELIEYETGK